MHENHLGGNGALLWLRSNLTVQMERRKKGTPQNETKNSKRQRKRDEKSTSVALSLVFARPWPAPFVLPRPGGPRTELRWEAAKRRAREASRQPFSCCKVSTRAARGRIRGSRWSEFAKAGSGTVGGVGGTQWREKKGPKGVKRAR